MIKTRFSRKYGNWALFIILFFLDLNIDFNYKLMNYSNNQNSYSSEIKSSDKYLSYPQICRDGVSGAIITWNYNANKIYTQKIDSSGYIKWKENGVYINTIDGSNMPKICSDGVGGAIIAWDSYRDSNMGHDIFTQAINSLGDVDWEIKGIDVCKIINDQENLQICSDGNGGVIITWQDERSGEGDIYVHRINSLGDIQWIPNGIEICIANGTQAAPQLCSDGNGGVIITWQDKRSGEGDIYAQRINSSGDIQWISNGLEICNASNYQYTPRICSDDNGGAIITWEDARNGLKAIYTQRINSSGDIQWMLNGIEVGTLYYSLSDIQVCSDGDGGVIITWSDNRNGEILEYNIYAQRVNHSGDVQWMSNGTEICTANGLQIGPQLCSDGNGGVIITWMDLRNKPTDIYAQRINSLGDVQWMSNGTEICTANERQVDPQLCSDGNGGAIITWEDITGNLGIYAQRVSGSGEIQWKEKGILIFSINNSGISLGPLFFLYFGIGVISLIFLIHRKLTRPNK